MSSSASDPTDFQKRVYDAVRDIPEGEVRTYGEIAEAAGSPGGAIAVGQALLPLEWGDDHDIPFWRVVLSDGAVARPDAEGRWPIEVARHRSVLIEEGVAFTDDGRVAGLASRPAATTRGVKGRPGSKPSQPTGPCWAHETIQYSCRDCVPPRR